MVAYFVSLPSHQIYPSHICRYLTGRSINSHEPNTPTIVAIVLVLIALILGVVISFLWYSKRRMGRMAGYSSMGGVWGWYSRLRYGSRPPDIEKGSSSFHSRFAALRSAGREKFDRRLPPQVIVEEPPAPLLPHIQKYPSLVERMGEAGASSLLSRSASQTSRALARPPPIRGSGLPARPDGSWRKEPPDPSTPPLREIPLEIPSPKAISPTSPVPLDTPPGTVPARFDRRQPSGSAMKPERQDSNRAERVRALHMDLTQDFRGLDSPIERSATMRAPNSHREDTSQLRKVKTVKSAKNLRFMLPSSPRNLLSAAPLRSAIGTGGNNGKSNLRPLLSASLTYSSDLKPPKTAFV